MNNIEELTDEQLEAAYLLRQKQKKDKADQDRNAYEIMRHELVEKLGKQALALEQQMAEFHAKASVSIAFKMSQYWRSKLSHYEEM